MMKKLLLVMMVLSCFSVEIQAQDFMGYRESNYSGVSGGGI